MRRETPADPPPLPAGEGRGEGRANAVTDSHRGLGEASKPSPSPSPLGGERIKPAATALEILLSAQRALRSRWEDFRQALNRRDQAAYELALKDFHDQLLRWTAEEEKVLLPALARVDLLGRDAQRELRVEYVQIRELTRYLLSQVSGRARLGDILGFVENLERRLAAHESEMEKVYYPAVAPVLLPEERRLLEEASPLP